MSLAMFSAVMGVSYLVGRRLANEREAFGVGMAATNPTMRDNALLKNVTPPDATERGFLRKVQPAPENERIGQYKPHYATDDTLFLENRGPTLPPGGSHTYWNLTQRRYGFTKDEMFDHRGGVIGNVKQTSPPYFRNSQIIDRLNTTQRGVAWDGALTSSTGQIEPGKAWQVEGTELEKDMVKNEARFLPVHKRQRGGPGISARSFITDRNQYYSSTQQLRNRPEVNEEKKQRVQHDNKLTTRPVVKSPHTMLSVQALPDPRLRKDRTHRGDTPTIKVQGAPTRLMIADTLVQDKPDKVMNNRNPGIGRTPYNGVFDMPAYSSIPRRKMEPLYQSSKSSIYTTRTMRVPTNTDGQESSVSRNKRPSDSDANRPQVSVQNVTLSDSRPLNIATSNRSTKDPSIATQLTKPFQPIFQVGVDILRSPITIGQNIQGLFPRPQRPL